MTEEFSQKVLTLLPPQFCWDTSMSLRTGINITDKMKVFMKVKTTLKGLSNTRQPTKAIAALVTNNDNTVDMTEKSNNPEHSEQDGTKPNLGETEGAPQKKQNSQKIQKWTERN